MDTGKTTLLKQLIHFTKHEAPVFVLEHTEEIKRCDYPERDITFFAPDDISDSLLASIRDSLNKYTATPIWVIGEISCSKEMQLVTKLLLAGYQVLATCHHHPQNLLNELALFGLEHDNECHLYIAKMELIAYDNKFCSDRLVTHVTNAMPFSKNIALSRDNFLTGYMSHGKKRS